MHLNIKSLKNMARKKNLRPKFYNYKKDDLFDSILILHEQKSTIKFKNIFTHVSFEF